MILGNTCVGAVAVAGMIAIWAPGCGDEATSEESEPNQVVLTSLTNSVFVPGYATVRDRCAELATAAETFCANTSSGDVETVRQAWIAARGPWKELEYLKFGPYARVPERFGSTMDFWPARPDSVQELLESDTELSAESLKSQGAAARGFPAVEVLLWGEDDSPIDGFGLGGRRCQYLVAATEDLAFEAAGLYGAWANGTGTQNPYALQLTAPGAPGNDFVDSKDALAEVVNRMGFTIENIRISKLTEPLGDETPHPELLESRLSGRSIGAIRDNLTGLEHAVRGGNGAEDLGLSDLLQLRGRADLVEEFAARLAAARASLDAIEEPLESALTNDRTDVKAAVESLASLQQVIQVDFLAALSLSLSFNDADGD